MTSETRATATGATAGPWEYHEGSSPHYQGQIYGRDGRTVAISYNDEGGGIARLIAAAPELLGALRRLTEKVRRANEIQHSGGTIEPEDWSELYQITNDARCTIEKAGG